MIKHTENEVFWWNSTQIDELLDDMRRQLYDTEFAIKDSSARIFALNKMITLFNENSSDYKEAQRQIDDKRCELLLALAQYDYVRQQIIDRLRTDPDKYKKICEPVTSHEFIMINCLKEK